MKTEGNATLGTPWLRLALKAWGVLLGSSAAGSGYGLVNKEPVLRAVVKSDTLWQQEATAAETKVDFFGLLLTPLLFLRINQCKMLEKARECLSNYREE